MYIKVVPVVCVLLVMMVDLWARYSLRPQSLTFRRVSQQYRDAVQSQPSRPGQPVSVLMVGNSLLLDGVDVARLKRATSGSLRIYPVFLEATTYYDWLYGLRRLFRQGARPQVLVVGLGPESLLESSVRPDYSPALLLDARDILRVSSDLHLDRTETVDLLLAHWSPFWDLRRMIRRQVLGRIVPGAQDLFARVQKKPTATITPATLEVATSRVTSLRQLGESYGSKVLLLIPPMPVSGNAVRQMKAVAQNVGVDVLVPIDPADLSERFYEADAVHLNANGAALFTSAIEAALPRMIAACRTISH